MEGRMEEWIDGQFDNYRVFVVYRVFVEGDFNEKKSLYNLRLSLYVYIYIFFVYFCVQFYVF